MINIAAMQTVNTVASSLSMLASWWCCFLLSLLFAGFVLLLCGAKVTRLSQTVASHQSLSRSLTHVRMQNETVPLGKGSSYD